MHFTGYEMEIEDIPVGDAEGPLLGCMVGTADLIGQMSDRMYLEKCREFLYREFVIGKVARETLPDGKEVVRYASADDLILKTPGLLRIRRAHAHRRRSSAASTASSLRTSTAPTSTRPRSTATWISCAATIETADLGRLRRFCYSLSDGAARRVRA